MVVNPEREEQAHELTDRVELASHEPERADDLPATADDVVAEGADVVAAVGGDGTQRTVAEAVAGTETHLAVVPGGTVNLLGRVLGVETVDDAAAAIEDGEVRHLDLGRCDGQVFVLNSSTGFDAEVIERTDGFAKKFGRVGYFTTGLVRLVRTDAANCTVTIDGQEIHDGPSLTVMVLNVGQRGSAKLKLAPDAEPDDGYLDVIVVGPSKRGMLRAGVSRVRDRRPNRDDVTLAQGRHIEVAWDREVPLQCDGDQVGRVTTVTYTIDPGVLAVRVPPGAG